MDVNGFRDPQSPWLFTSANNHVIEARVRGVEAPSRDTYPTPDSRYPGWAAPMEDGRIATDYRPRCSKNIPTGQQFATRGWMQRNAEELMNLSRKRQAQLAGAGQTYDPHIEVGPSAYIKCDPTGCSYTEVNGQGVGVERREHVPDLFGTFAQSSPFFGTQDVPIQTLYEEGGRNTRRGFF